MSLDEKGGKVAKSARAVQFTQGELDGSRGIKFEYGKLTVINGALASLQADFPGIDLQAVFNKVAPEIAKNKYPTMELAMTLIRKWSQFAKDDAVKGRRGFAATETNADESAAERRARKLRAMAEGEKGRRNDR
jgi:hypothetical protein